MHRRTCIEVDALPNVRERQYFGDRKIAALLDELHHQIVIRDAEIMESAKPGARVHQDVEQHPTLRIEDFLTREVCRICFVDGCHEVEADPGEARGASIVIVDDARRRRCSRIDDVVVVRPSTSALDFARMMIEREVAA